MRKFILSFALLLLAGTVFAQTKERTIRRFEGEPNFGIATIGFATLCVELRYNFNQRPWDVGVNSAFDFNGGRVTVVGDYNFAREKNCSFFVGVGAGWANTSILNIDETLEQCGDACYASTQECLCVYPRIGLEFFQHLRLIATVNTYNFKEAELLLSLGFAIGGGRKK